MLRSYFLWAFGPDRPGVVAHVAEIVYRVGGSIQDSSMMRLGSEFAIFLIFTHTKSLPHRTYSELAERLRTRSGIECGIKTITNRAARFVPPSKRGWIVSAYGEDRRGLVYRISDVLARYGFNISDLSTHRTNRGSKSGYIIVIEGELTTERKLKALQGKLKALQSTLSVRIAVRPAIAQIV